MIGQIAKRYKDFKLSRLISAKIIGLLIALFIFFYLIHHIHFRDFFPIKEVNISGVVYTNQNDLQKALQPLVDHGFFVVDMEQIKQRLLLFPWVSKVTVRREWPQKIDINLIERQSLARWNDLGLISASGEIFNPSGSNLPERLPQFVGSPGDQMQMVRYYGELTKILSSLGFKIDQLEFTPAHAWYVVLSNGIKLNVGHNDVLTRMHQFVKVYPKIVGNRASDVEYIDLRYSNGLAVRWKT